MTRHYLPPTNPNVADTVVIGFDRITDTYFAQVYQAENFPEMITWIPGLPATLPGLFTEDGPVCAAQDIIDEIEEHAIVPEGLVAALEAEWALAHSGHLTTDRANRSFHWSTTGLIDADAEGNGGQ